MGNPYGNFGRTKASWKKAKNGRIDNQPRPQEKSDEGKKDEEKQEDERVLDKK